MNINDITKVREGYCVAWTTYGGDMDEGSEQEHIVFGLSKKQAELYEAVLKALIDIGYESADDVMDVVRETYDEDEFCNDSECELVLDKIWGEGSNTDLAYNLLGYPLDNGKLSDRYIDIFVDIRYVSCGVIKVSEV